MLKKINEKSASIAFTLAEVLVTLAVIGVVAALTIPNLVKKYQQHVYATSLKKAYAQIEQVFKLYMADEGVTDLSQTPVFQAGYDYTRLKEMLYKYFRVTKYCYYGTECGITESNLDPSQGSFGTQFTNYATIYTADGLTIMFHLGDGVGCKPNANNPTKGACFDFDIDTNGTKSPNIRGRDYFDDFLMSPYGEIYPCGSREFAQFYAYNPSTGSITGWEGYPYWRNRPQGCGSADSSNITGANGAYCAARIRDESWQMLY